MRKNSGSQINGQENNQIMVQKLKRRMPRTKSSVKGNRAIEIRKKRVDTKVESRYKRGEIL